MIDKTKGLKKHYKIKEKSTQDALKRAIDKLKKMNARRKWSKSEVCKQAGLKSTNALYSPRHQNIVRVIEEHNASVDVLLAEGPIRPSEKQHMKVQIKRLREDISTLKEQLAKSCSYNAQYQAETEWYKDQAEHLRRQKDRMTTRIKELQEEL